MARGWKRVAERLLVRSGLARAAAGLKRPTAAVLAYHNIVPEGEPVAGDVSLHVDQQAFADQLDYVLDRYDVVSLDEARARASNAGGRSCVVVTFDDAYYGTMTAGVDELRARRVPGTVFVPPGLLGADGFWWDRLAPEGGLPLPDSIRAHALQALGGHQPRVMAWAADQGIEARDLPSHARPADEETVLRRASYELLTLGAHTWEHPNLTAITPEAASAELRRSRAWLQSRAPRYIDWLAYPYGLRTDEVVAEAAKEFDGAVLIEGGLARVRGHWTAPSHAIPRLNVPRGLTLEGLALRLAGLLQ